MARYVIRAAGESGPVEFNQRLTIDAALRKAKELRAAHFQRITLVNVETGVEIGELETLIADELPDARAAGIK